LIACNLSRPVTAGDWPRRAAPRQYDLSRSLEIARYLSTYFLLENNAISVTHSLAIDTARYACFIRGEIARFRLREPIKTPI